jgi:hypothetical protein
MSHYSAFLRPHHGKTIGNSSSSNNENDENSTIKNLIFKHISKAQQSSTTNKGTMRGILGEVGNMTLSNKPIISKPKIIQQNSIATIIESQSIINIPPPAPPPSSSTITTTTNVANYVEEIVLDNDFESLTEIPAEFDCDSGDLLNITTVSEFVVDICKYWRELEQHTPIRQNFLLRRREGR